jgi:hypothetical protein
MRDENRGYVMNEFCVWMKTEREIIGEWMDYECEKENEALFVWLFMMRLIMPCSPQTTCGSR